MVELSLRSRRDVWRFAGSLAIGAFVGRARVAAATPTGDRVLSLYAANTGEPEARGRGDRF